MVGDDRKVAPELLGSLKRSRAGARARWLVVEVKQTHVPNRDTVIYTTRSSRTRVSFLPPSYHRKAANESFNTRPPPTSPGELDSQRLHRCATDLLPHSRADLTNAPTSKHLGSTRCLQFGATTPSHSRQSSNTHDKLLRLSTCIHRPR